MVHLYGLYIPKTPLFLLFFIKKKCYTYYVSIISFDIGFKNTLCFKLGSLKLYSLKLS